MSNIKLAAAAKAAGKTRFTSICKKHGEGDFWVASRRCVRCAYEAKTPAVQAAYWEKNRAAIAAKRKAKNNPCN